MIILAIVSAVANHVQLLRQIPPQPGAGWDVLGSDRAVGQPRQQAHPRAANPPLGLSAHGQFAPCPSGAVRTVLLRLSVLLLRSLCSVLYVCGIVRECLCVCVGGGGGGGVGGGGGGGGGLGWVVSVCVCAHILVCMHVFCECVCVCALVYLCVHRYFIVCMCHLCGILRTMTT